MIQATPALLLTRPRAESEAFLAELRARVTVDKVVVAPVMRIVPTGARPDMSDVTAVILTSANAARLYHGPTGRKAFCVGRKTTETARAAGLDAEFCGENADGLVAHLLKTRPAGHLLHLRGAHARGDIVARLTDSGLRASDAVIYDQQAQPLSPEARALLNGADPVILPLFSPRSADILAAEGVPRAPVQVVAISAAVAEHAAALRPREVQIAKNPDRTAVCELVVALYLRGTPLEGG